MKTRRIQQNDLHETQFDLQQQTSSSSQHARSVVAMPESNKTSPPRNTRRRVGVHTCVRKGEMFQTRELRMLATMYKYYEKTKPHTCQEGKRKN